MQYRGAGRERGKLKRLAVPVIAAVALLATGAAPLHAEVPTDRYYSGCTAWTVPADAQVVLMRVIGAPGGNGTASGLGRGAGIGGKAADIAVYVRVDQLPGNTLYLTVG